MKASVSVNYWATGSKLQDSVLLKGQQILPPFFRKNSDVLLAPEVKAAEA